MATQPLPATEASGVPAADVFPVGRQATLAYRVARVTIGPLVRCLFRIRVSGRENLPAGACVLIANHLNWVDSFAILLAFPAEPRVHFLGDPTELIQRRFQWWVIRRIGGYVPVDRSRRSGERLFTHVDRCLARGGVVALYPEGRYGTEEGSLLPLKRGFAHFAIRAGVSVVPVGLSGTRDLWWRKRIHVIVGAPIPSLGLATEELVLAGEAGLRAVLPPPTRSRAPKLFRAVLTNLL